MTKRSYLIWLFLALYLFQVPAFAEDCDRATYSEASYAAMLEGFGNNPCLDPENNNTPLGSAVKAILAASSNDRNAALEALQEIESHISVVHINTNNSQASNARLLEQAIAGLRTSMAAREKIPEAHLIRDYRLNDVNEMPDKLPGINLFSALEVDDCETVSDAKCDAQYDAAEDMVRAIKLVDAAIGTYTKNYRSETTIDRQIRHEKWDSYYEDLTFQYPWELLANSWYLGWLDDRTEVDGNKVGFMPMPTSKITFLHPDVNPVYHEDSDDEADIAFTVETLGFEKFKFDNSTGKIRSSWGVSHMAAYLPQTDSGKSKWNNGWMFKYNQYSIGIIDDDDERAVVFNINLSQRLFEVKQKKREYFDDLRFKADSLKNVVESYQ